jgi:hypothetical protein
MQVGREEKPLVWGEEYTQSADSGQFTQWGGIPDSAGQTPTMESKNAAEKQEWEDF